MTSFGASCRLRPGRRGSSGSHMHPVVNIEDPVGKVVGRRRLTEGNYINYALGLQKCLGDHSRLSYPKGVFRFRSHEEADQWLVDNLIRKPAN
jgi:hypothetical protein